MVNCVKTRSAARIYTEHLSMILRTRIRLKRMSAQKNDCSPFFPNGEAAPKGGEGSGGMKESGEMRLKGEK